MTGAQLLQIFFGYALIGRAADLFDRVADRDGLDGGKAWTLSHQSCPKCVTNGEKRSIKYAMA